MVDQRALEDQIQELPIDPEQVLTDGQLEAGGLAPVTTWARTKASKNALRVKKAKEKKEVEGIKKFNIQAAIALHPTLKAIAKASPEQIAAVQAVLAGTPPAGNATSYQRQIEVGQKCLALEGWKQTLVALLIGAKLRPYAARRG